jgi:hypothetical protein
MTMTMQLSAKLANLIASGSDVRSAIGDFKRYLYSGTIPATADSAINGTLLAVLTKDGNTAAFEVLPRWKVTIAGSMGGTVTVKLGGAPIHAAVTSVTDATTTAALLATAINGTLVKPFSGFTATSTGADLFVIGPKGSGASLNALTCTSAVTSSVTATVASSGLPDGANGTTLGVASSNCCGFDQRAVAGVLTSSETWKDNSADTTGSAAWYRDVYDAADTGTATTAYLRRQGSVTSIGGGGDFELASTSITATTPITATGATFTIPST